MHARAAIAHEHRDRGRFGAARACAYAGWAVVAGVMRPKRGGWGDPERDVEVALAEAELAGWGEVAVCGAEVALPDLAQLCPDRAPGLLGAGLGEADEDEREEADQHVGADALVFAVEDWSQQQRALEVAEGALASISCL